MNSKRESKMSHYCRNLLLPFALLFAICLAAGTARTNSAATKAALQPRAEERDGQHDFDFFVGTWKFHLKRRLKPLTGSNSWVEFDGIDVDRNILNGKANIDELAVDGPRVTSKG